MTFQLVMDPSCAGAHKRKEQLTLYTVLIHHGSTNFNCTCVNLRVQSSPYKVKMSTTSRTHKTEDCL